MLKKYHVSCILLIIIFCMLLAGCGKKRETMQWAQNLKANDIEQIEVRIYPPQEDKNYKKYKPEEFESVVEMINQCSGKYTKRPKEVAGGSCQYIVTMKDETVHYVGTNGENLVIDGDNYQADTDWLYQWLDSIVADSPMPENFEEYVQKIVDSYA